MHTDAHHIAEGISNETPTSGIIEFVGLIDDTIRALDSADHVPGYDVTVLADGWRDLRNAITEHEAEAAKHGHPEDSWATDLPPCP